jgi:hypothetical protein
MYEAWLTERRLEEERALTEPVGPGAGNYRPSGAGADRTATLEGQVKQLEADVQRLLNEFESMKKN